ncbi:MAG TPA: large-conductance mechanosensitive channel protein MscL [Cytophagaceae bacterium]|jgi:large conductance mechanosensitive channel
MSFLYKFKEFAFKGNVIDLAVGIVIGTAFGRIVTSLVADIIMPPIGMIIGGVDFSDLKVVLKEAEKDETGKVIKEVVSVNYGLFFQNIFDFLIIAASIFLLVSLISTFRKKQEAPVAPAAKSDEVLLLEQIRDLLKTNKN